MAKVVSDYRYRASELDFEQYAARYGFPVDHHKYVEDGKLAVDFVGSFDRLKSDLAFVVDKIGLKFDGWLPHAKGKSRKRNFTVEDLNDGQRRRVRAAFKTEYELLASLWHAN